MLSIICKNPKIKQGDKFHRLTAIGPEFRLRGLKNGLPIAAQNATVYRCDCGAATVQYRNNVIDGRVKSCGCLRESRHSSFGLTHGDSKTKLYRLWKAMKERCESSSHKSYPDYGGRGIRVCDEWNKDFVAFRDWALANGYKPGLQIDRYPDNDGNYDPSNCRFTAQKQNVNNTRKNVFIEWRGERKTITQWSEDSRCCVNYGCFRKRLRDGWEIEEAMTTPPIRK